MKAGCLPRSYEPAKPQDAVSEGSFITGASKHKQVSDLCGECNVIQLLKQYI